MKVKGITLEFTEEELETNTAEELIHEIEELIPELKKISKLTVGEKVTFLTHHNMTTLQPFVVIDFED